MLFRASRSDMSNLTDCITNERDVAVTADKNRLLVAFTPFEFIGTLMAGHPLYYLFGLPGSCLYCHISRHGIRMAVKITVEDLMKEVVTYRHFMKIASGGGVTGIPAARPFAGRICTQLVSRL